MEKPKRITDLESELEERGYRRITGCKAELRDDYEYYKAFYYPINDDGERMLKYQIFFEFWDFTKYGRADITPENGFSVSICIMPESCRGEVGRRDLQLSVDWWDKVDKIEDLAENYYEFITKYDEKID